MTAASGPGFPVHRPAPVAGTAYTVSGMNTGRRADERLMRSYPMEAHCGGCGQMIRRESAEGDWSHTGRRPGDPGPMPTI